MKVRKSISKEVIWSFSHDLNHMPKKYGKRPSIRLSNKKNSDGKYKLLINGKKHFPTRKQKVYDILRKVNPKFTEWWETCNRHFLIDKK